MTEQRPTSPKQPASARKKRKGTAQTKPTTPKAGFVRSIRFIFREAWAASPRAAIFSFLELLSNAVDGIMPALYGGIVAAVVAGNATIALVLAALVGILFGFARLIVVLGVGYRTGLMQALADRFEGRTAQMLASLPTTSHHEEPASMDAVQALRDRGGAVGAAYNMVMNALNSIIAPVTALVVAIGADWRLVFIALAGIPQILVTRRISRISKEAEEAGAESSRRVERLVELTADRSGASEVRTFGARDFLLRRIRTASHAWIAPEVAASKRIAVLMLSTFGFFFAVGVAVLAWMTHDALAGVVGVAAMTIALTSLENLHNAIGSIRMGITMLNSSLRNVDRYLWLADHLEHERAAHAGTIQPPEKLTNGIRFVDVTFTRPGGTQPIFEHLNLDLPAGTTIALVGENGAGKTTLVDLLLGLHDLDDGHIEINGISLADLDLPAWRERCAGAFQDHLTLETTAQHAIGLGDLPHVDDPDAAGQALEDAAATDVLTALPDGLATQLGPTWEDGVGLSGGQWQRLAIARGMMRRTPLLRVLDEPTSALDPATEDALFRRYAETARETSATGGITVLVTHRFSTVAAADTVIVLDHGTVTEHGTHHQLMHTGGHYAELYHLQARGYS
jgi:ATP-binding cassette subfamily B protein